MYRLIPIFFVLTHGGEVSKVHSPIINMYYSQDTKCTNGLIAKLDSFQIISNVSFQHASNDWGKAMTLYIYGAKQCFQFLLSLDSGRPYISQDGCSQEGSLNMECSIGREHDTKYIPRCTFQADASFSQAIAFGKLTNRQGQHRKSNNITMPLMHNMSAIRLHVNEEIMSRDTIHDRCTFYINREMPAIRACCENAPSPCTVKIYNKGNEVAQGEQCVFVKSSAVKSSNYTFSFMFCGKPETTESYICQALYDNGICLAINVLWIITALLISLIIKEME